ncbi:hypothetical protein NDU88_002987 [Pleurodeles waltl]|uniref:Uncharacterized protein n=1 Tax=Pleurodeles waltl TaxID=8319 RepID=A0AAV7RFK0_PLEWA|nr:hypothetical protein NDU88_002987 [Pleurodeles waltl]
MHEVQLAHLTDRVQRVEYRVEDVEGRSQRNKVCIIGLPERAEGADMVTFLEPWLKSLLGEQQFTPFFGLERAQRGPAKLPASGRPPRPGVAKLLHYKDRDILLQRVREAGPFEVENSRVNMFPGYTVEVQAKGGGSYLEVKRLLREEGICYALLFPSKLKIMWEGRTHFCQTLRKHDLA